MAAAPGHDGRALPLADLAAIGHAMGWLILASSLANALIPTMLQDLASVNLRARCSAAYSFLIAAFCALGPVLSGAISQFVVADNLLLAIVVTGVPVLCVTVVCAAMSVFGPAPGPGVAAPRRRSPA